jgi:3-deoxy-D-manno-octulosonic-acid transferase
MLRRGHFREKFGQRLGRYSAEDRGRFERAQPIWIQSISVGETLIALKLAREIHRQKPERLIVLSVTTSTGFALVREHASEWLEPIYNPIDLRSIARRALRIVRPSRLVIIEGGIWPNLLAECARTGIPATLAAARLSPRSERRFRKFRAWTGPVFRLLDRVLVPEPADVARWESLGVPAAKIRCTGSIKFDQAAAGSASRVEEFRSLLAALGIHPEAPILVAGSTHAGEEKLLAGMLPALREKHPGLVFLIVPRHVERTPEILRELASTGLRIARRSALAGAHGCDLLLVDSTGELRDWYALATVVFVGKSLTAEGGQNPAEPALLGRPVIFGPHMENFEAVVAHLLAQDAAVQVSGAAELPAAIEALLRDPARRAALAGHAREALASHQGATARSAEFLGA